MKKISALLSGVIACAMAISGIGMTVGAANVVEIPGTEVDSVYNMKVDSNTIEGWPAGPQIYSESGIVMDMDSGAVLYAKKIDDQHYPASITKVATALVALQNYQMDETVTFTWDDIGFLEYGDAHIGIKDGEELLMEDAMYGMLLASANEVSHAIGAHMEGGYEVFLQKMNEAAAALGCRNSHFTNTHGLHDPEHYTCVRDMALIGSAVFQYEKFREITGTLQHTIPSTNITEETRTFQQNHKMLWKANANYYEYCVGGKTGYTDQALTTLVTFATKEDKNLVAVVMRTHGGGQNAYADTRAMLDYAFDNFAKVPVTKEMAAGADFKVADIAEVEAGAFLMLPNGVTTENLDSVFTVPTELRDKVGTASFTYKGQEVGTVRVTVTDDYYNEIHGIQPEEETQEVREKKSGLPGWAKWLLGILGVLLLAFAVLVGYVYYKRKQLEKMRRQRRMEQRRRREEGL